MRQHEDDFDSYSTASRSTIVCIAVTIAVASAAVSTIRSVPRLLAAATYGIVSSAGMAAAGGGATSADASTGTAEPVTSTTGTFVMSAVPSTIKSLGLIAASGGTNKMKALARPSDFFVFVNKSTQDARTIHADQSMARTFMDASCSKYSCMFDAC